MSGRVSRAGAVCAVILNHDGLVLAVSRKDDPNDFGLPGGKVERGESELDALRRELKEETGLSFRGEPVRAFERKDHGLRSVSYWALGGCSGRIRTRESGRVLWVPIERLFSGRFGAYNRRLFDALAKEGALSAYYAQIPLHSLAAAREVYAKLGALVRLAEGNGQKIQLHDLAGELTWMRDLMAFAAIASKSVGARRMRR